MKKSFLILGFFISLLISCPPPTPVPGPETDEGTSGNITVRFDPNGGSGSVTEIKGNLGDTFTFPECTATRQYYTFIGWSYRADNIDPDYQPGEKFLLTSKEERIFYAVWTQSQIDITFNPNVKNGKTVVKKANAGFYFSLPDGNDLFSVKENNQYFVGWKTSPDSTVIDGPGTSIKIEEKPLTFYATYESAQPESKTLSLVFDGYNEGLTLNGDSSITFNKYTKIIRLPLVTPDTTFSRTVKADFLGWTADENPTQDSQIVYGNEAVIDNPWINLTHTTLRSVLNARKSVMLQFDLNTQDNPNASWNGSSQNQGPYYSGDKVFLLSPSYSEDYGFMGWKYGDNIYHSELIIPTPLPLSPIQLTAVWKANVTQSLDTNGAHLTQIAEANGGENYFLSQKITPGRKDAQYLNNIYTYFYKQPSNGKAYICSGISVTTESNKSVPVTKNEEIYWDELIGKAFTHTYWTYIVPEENYTIKLNWQETELNAKITILAAESDSLTITSFPFSVDSPNFNVLDDQNNSYSVMCLPQEPQLALFFNGDPLPENRTYRLQFRVENEILDEQTFTIGKTTPFEWELGEAKIESPVGHSDYILSVPVIIEDISSFFPDMDITKPDQNSISYPQFNRETKTITASINGFDVTIGETLYLQVIQDGITKTRSFTIPDDEFHLYPSNESAQIALFRESATSSVDIYIPIEKTCGTFYSFDVKTTKNGSPLNTVYSITNRQEDDLYSLRVYGSGLTVGGTYTLTITPWGKTTPEVTCTVAIPADIQLRKKVMVSPL